MKKPRSRKEVFDQYQKTSSKQWAEQVTRLATTSHKQLPKLYHLSTIKQESGRWLPRPDRSKPQDNKAHPVYGELVPDMISTSSTLEGCWAGIFPFLFKDFEHSKIKVIRAYLYEVTPATHSPVLTPSTLTMYYLIQDAHLTQEYGILGPCQIKLVEEVLFENTMNVDQKLWVNGYCFNEARYGRTNYAPMRVIARHPTNKESPMSELNLTFSAPMLTRQLALEAITNPLGVMGETMTTKYSVLLTRLNVLKMQISETSKASNSPTVRFNPRPISAICRKHNYMDLASTQIYCPTGFIGPLKSYLNTLISGLERLGTIRQGVLTPIQNEIGVLLANPERLSKASPGKPQSIKDALEDKAKFEKRIKEHYNTKAEHEYCNYNRLFAANSDFIDCGHLVPNLETQLKKASEVLKDIEKDISAVSQMTDKLAVRISQGNPGYQMNNVVAAQIAELLADGAECVSFLSALTVMGREAIGMMTGAVEQLKDI